MINNYSLDFLKSEFSDLEKGIITVEQFFDRLAGNDDLRKEMMTSLVGFGDWEDLDEKDITKIVNNSTMSDIEILGIVGDTEEVLKCLMEDDQKSLEKEIKGFVRSGEIDLFDLGEKEDFASVCDRKFYPADMFDEKELEDWAESNMYVKVEE